MKKIFHILNTPLAAILVWSLVGLAAYQQHFLSDHIDVSTAGASSGDVLTYNGTNGWKASAPATDISGTSDEQILFNDGGSIAGSSGLTYDGSGVLITTSAPRLTLERTGAGSASVDLKTTSNYWFFYANSDNFGIEPQTINGTFLIRNLANTNLFTINTSNGLISTGSSTQFRVNGLGGNAESIAGYDDGGDLTEFTLGAGLAITSGTLSTDQTAAETTYDNSTSGLTATDVKAGIDELASAIPDNINDLTISSTVDFDDNRITGVANAEVASDAVNKEQLDSLETIISDYHSLDFQAIADGDTLVLTKEKTLVLMDGSAADIDAYIDGSAVSSGSLIYIKYGNTSTDVTLNRDATNDAGNFLAESSLTTASTLDLAGNGMTVLLKYGATWYQLH